MMASGYNFSRGDAHGVRDEVDDDLALALARSRMSFQEEQQWDEVKDFVLDESAIGKCSICWC